ncbi:6-pyruvoyl trahydropterin synthase family protein [Streptomyces hiroshimensis]|uniref:6-carboxy-5,6,7,8-tetrahydropterin synthase n=1 Tax=Streptomyces hiroshimensis TaxID=66424 RepID=A0ABQ2YLB9_9ACTN|nr:6-carboxytetrahydropterin synthase [Streptomyces hiroshimensis]GGX88173.1 6-carboxy-5,6,7,8-tetrahydropterin synthase [Streptomyces hiroshimensis]
MTLRITKQFAFSASHQLAGLPEGHQCGRLHGHNYVVEVELSAGRDRLTPPGFVRDYGELSELKKWIDELLDHRHLNDVVKEQNPSAENLAVWIYEQWFTVYPELTAVRVSETPKTWAEYRP